MRIIKTSDGPGCTLQTEKTKLIYGVHYVAPYELLSDKHYDILVRYAFARAVLLKEVSDIMFWQKTYEDMQEARVGYHDTDGFLNLIKSSTQRGIMSPIPVDPTYNILDGSHRTAVALALNILAPVAIYKDSSNTYSREYLAQHLDPEAMQELNILWRNFLTIQKDVLVFAIWGGCLEHWDLIMAILLPHKIIRSFIFKPRNVQDFIIESYQNDGMSNERIHEKSQRIAQQSDLVGIIAIEKDFLDASDIKRSIRSFIAPRLGTNYFFDNIIHSFDTNGLSFLKRFDIKL